MNDPDLSVEAMKGKSAAAANLWTWVVNIYKFNRIYVKVKPLMDKLEAAKASKAEADASLAAARRTVARVEDELAKLQDKVLAGRNGREAGGRGRGRGVFGPPRPGRAPRRRARVRERALGVEIEELKVLGREPRRRLHARRGLRVVRRRLRPDNRDALWKTIWMEDLSRPACP